MAIFSIRSSRNVHEDSQQSNPTHNVPDPAPQPSSHTSRSTEVVPEDVMQFDDDMAHFVTHLDADPLAEGHLKMHLVEYNIEPEEAVVKETVEEEDGYTYRSAPSPIMLTVCRFLSFKKLSYAAVTALLPPSRTPTPPVTHVPFFPTERPGSSHSNRKSSRQRDFTVPVIKDNESDCEIDWNAHKARRGKTRAMGIAKKRAIKIL